MWLLSAVCAEQATVSWALSGSQNGAVAMATHMQSGRQVDEQLTEKLYLISACKNEQGTGRKSFIFESFGLIELFVGSGQYREQTWQDKTGQEYIFTPVSTSTALCCDEWVCCRNFDILATEAVGMLCIFLLCLFFEHPLTDWLIDWLIDCRLLCDCLCSVCNVRMSDFSTTDSDGQARGMSGRKQLLQHS